MLASPTLWIEYEAVLKRPAIGDLHRATGGVEAKGRTTQELMSINSAEIRETDTDEVSVGGISLRRSKTVARMEKCTDQFREAQEDYIRREGLKSRGEVNGSVQ